jgi:hypothetical protein
MLSDVSIYFHIHCVSRNQFVINTSLEGGTNVIQSGRRDKCYTVWKEGQMLYRLSKTLMKVQKQLFSFKTKCRTLQ